MNVKLQPAKQTAGKMPNPSTNNQETTKGRKGEKLFGRRLQDPPDISNSKE